MIRADVKTEKISFSPMWRFYPSVNKCISLRWTLQMCVITDVKQTGGETRCSTFILLCLTWDSLLSKVRFQDRAFLKNQKSFKHQTPKSWFWGLSPPPHVNIQGPVKQLLLHVTITDCRYSSGGNKEPRSLNDPFYELIPFFYSVHYSRFSREPDAPSLAGSAAPSSFNSMGDVDMIRGLYGGKMCRLCSSLDSLQWTKR